MTPTTAAPELTREQDAYAEQLAIDHDSVEVRLLHDGVASVTTRTGEPGKLVQRTRLVDEDGNEFSPFAVVDRNRREAERCTQAMLRLVGDAPAAQVESLRCIVIEAMRAWPQYDGNFDGWTLAVGTRRMETKGGLCHEPGDLLLVGHDRDPGFRTAFSVRRLGQVSVHAYTLRDEA